ncbi:hypothetical protein FQN54_005836 [Arachnomyces sp. PD_36]|nr:hypothetical protein FQN54_005836 [Arachnomyces sp. PD_36]
MSANLSVGAALLEWINSFPLGTTIGSANELSDGTILWEIVQDIDPQYFLGELPETSSNDAWVQKWQNLKHIHKLLLSYIRSQNNDQIPGTLDPSPDLKLIAEKSSTKETNKLLKLLLIAAINSPSAETYVSTMPKLSTETQEGLKNIIEASQGPPAERFDEDGGDTSGPSYAMDPELQFEERVGKVLAENDKLSNEKKELEKALEDLHNRLARLQENNDTLQNRLTTTEDRLMTLKSGRGELGPNAKVLESKTRQQEDLIASQEAKITASQDEIDSLRKSVESLKIKNQRFQTLQDDYDELKNERDQLSRRANASEKYRQKLQASQDFEKQNIALNKQIEDLQQQLKEADSNFKTSSERDVELEEYRRLIPKIEQDRHEIQNLKKQLEFNNHALTERLESADEQRTRDEATISELREQLRELEVPGTPYTSEGNSPGATTPKARSTLQRDFDNIGRRETQLSVEILKVSDQILTSPSKTENDDLKKELDRLKSENPGATVKDPRLEELLRDTHNGYKQLSERNLTAYSDNLIRATELARAKSIERSIPKHPMDHPETDRKFSEEYWKLFDQFKLARQNLAEAEKKLEITERELSDSQQARESMGSSLVQALDQYSDYVKVSLVSKDQQEIVQEIRESNTAELAKMRTEWDGLQHKVRYLEAEYDISLALVRDLTSERDTLNEKLNARTEGPDQASTEEMQKLLEEFNARANDTTDTPEKTGNDLLKHFAEVTEKSAEKLAKRNEEIEHQAGVISSLQEQLKQLEETSGQEGQDQISRERETELLKTIQRQEREISLVSTAWYNVQSRLPNSNVTVSRYRHPASTSAGGGAETKQSWLAKQRGIVAGGGAR